jgi:hypothetical protein
MSPDIMMFLPELRRGVTKGLDEGIKFGPLVERNFHNAKRRIPCGRKVSFYGRGCFEDTLAR